ncbi:MAG TPA: O-antigen ligase family protein [Chloroflexia bacterium]|nr:O-antigen ligase family protein [Chloroflexia bacterium]
MRRPWTDRPLRAPRPRPARADPRFLLYAANSPAGRLITLALVGGASGALVRLGGPRLVAAGVAGAVAVAGLLRWWPGSAVALLLITVALNRFVVPVAGADVKPEHVAILLVAGILGLRWATTARPATRAGAAGTAPAPRAPLRLTAARVAPACLILYLGLNGLSSLLNALQPDQSLRLTGLVTLVTLPYFLLPWLIRDGRDLRRAVMGWLGLATLEALLGLAIMVLYRQGIDLGVQVVLGSPPVPIGTMREGNIFGSYLAAAVVAALAFMLSSARARTLLGATGVGGLTLGGVAISLARGAWLGCVIGVGLVLACRIRTAARRGVALALLAVALLPLLLAFANSPFLEEARFYVEQRLTSLNPDTILNDATVAERLDTYDKAWEGIAIHPWVGNGTGSFGQRYYYRSVAQPAWIGNLELHLLYDTGLWGLLAFSGFLVASGWEAFRAYRRSRDPERRALILALGAGLLVLLVAYQATEATWLAFTWAHLGLLRAAARAA